MLRFMTKEDVWSAMDAGHLHQSGWGVNDWANFSIKQMQDAVLLHLLDNPQGLDILEVGGGNSRTLPHLWQRNRCVNADPAEGSGHGPVDIDPAATPWKHVFKPAGEFAPELADESFDVVYSISVLEHVVETPDVDRAFNDMVRVLRAGGRMIHLVDTYLQDHDGDNSWGRERIASHLYRLVDHPDLVPAGEILESDQIFLRGAYASNSDLVMKMWNEMSPSIRHLRSAGQACSFILEANRKSPGQARL